jgi:hypothetical protein
VLYYFVLCNSNPVHCVSCLEHVCRLGDGTFCALLASLDFVACVNKADNMSLVLILRSKSSAFPSVGKCDPMISLSLQGLTEEFKREDVEEVEEGAEGGEGELRKLLSGGDAVANMYSWRLVNGIWGVVRAMFYSACDHPRCLENSFAW